jgi:hypothetical protein
MGDDGDTVTSQGHRRPASDADANRDRLLGSEAGLHKVLGTGGSTNNSDPNSTPASDASTPNTNNPADTSDRQRRMIDSWTDGLTHDRERIWQISTVVGLPLSPN